MRTLAMLLAAAVIAGGAEVEERETIRKTFPLTGSDRRELFIDTFNGAIHVKGYNGNEVRATIEKRLRADAPERAADARREVKLEADQQGNRVRFYVNAPWRHQGHDDYRGRRYYGYEVAFDFDVEVPRNAVLTLKSVNNKQGIRVENTSGDFWVENVNGGIEMSETGGSGHVRTINGGIHVTFAKNPGAASDFSSINGVVEVAFQPGLAANLRCKTFNGGVYTDFPVTYLPAAAPAPERRDGKFVYRSNRGFGVRVGAGGPELKFDTLNGNIQIRNRGQ